LPRPDLNLDTPNSKPKYRAFLKDLKDLEHEPFIVQLKFTLKQLAQLPKKIHWRVLLDLADLAKRESQISYACRLFKVATTLQPYAY
jgi:la-related protein 1